MSLYTIFKKRPELTIPGMAILLCALLWLLSAPVGTKTWQEVQREREAAEKEIVELEQKLAATTDSLQAEQLQLAIAERGLSLRENHGKWLDHLQQVSDTAAEPEQLCSLLWGGASQLQLEGFANFSWKEVDWIRVRPAYERIVRLCPESDLARRALYQLGRYHLVEKNFPVWRYNREEFIRRFGTKKPFYAAVAEKEIGDSFLFEGNPEKAQEHYQQLLSRLAEQEEGRLDAELYLRLLQSSWVKSSTTSPDKLRRWRRGLADSLAGEAYQNYDVSDWLKQLLEENRTMARRVPLSEWPEHKELSPYDFITKFEQDVYDHAVMKTKIRPLEWLSKTTKTKRKVTRVQSDLRSIATALEAYLVDWCGGYPPLKLGGLRYLTGVPVRPGYLGKMDQEVTRYLEQPQAITQYLRMIPLDPFGKESSDFYYYYTGDPPIQNQGWIVFSRGPDGSFEIDPANDYDTQIPQPSPKLLLKSYDPTNGTYSRGDIFRVKS